MILFPKMKNIFYEKSDFDDTYITEQEDTWGFCGANVEYMICASEGFSVVVG